jgi:RNA recognition motif-containing protein
VELVNDKKTHKTRGFAFVTFDDNDSVERCIQNKIHKIKGFRCNVKKALSREELLQQKKNETAEIVRASLTVVEDARAQLDRAERARSELAVAGIQAGGLN